MKHHLSLCSYSLPLLSLAAHTQAPSERKPVVRQPGIDSAHENSAKPPLVKLIRGSATGSWAKHWSLALLFTAWGLQWTLFWIRRLPGCPSNSIHARRHLYHIRINYSITTPVLIICGWMETGKKKKWKWRMMQKKSFDRRWSIVLQHHYHGCMHMLIPRTFIYQIMPGASCRLSVAWTIVYAAIYSALGLCGVQQDYSATLFFLLKGLNVYRLINAIQIQLFSSVTPRFFSFLFRPLKRLLTVTSLFASRA